MNSCETRRHCITDALSESEEICVENGLIDISKCQTKEDSATLLLLSGYRLTKTLFLIVLAIPFASFAETKSSLSTRYENLDFDNSVQKTQGERYGLSFDLKDQQQRFQADYETTRTKTIQPPNPSNLEIDKYYLRYGRKLMPQTRINMGVMHISDSLAPTDGGNIYGLGLKYKNRGVSLFHSDYDGFKVNQLDLHHVHKTQFNKANVKTTLLTKYIKLDGKDSNTYSHNAEDDYLTAGIKVGVGYQGYRFGANTFFGKRAFAVMKNGFKVQHHAQEFSNSYGLSIAKKIGKTDLKLKYAYLKGEELPRKNPNVKTEVIGLELKHHF